MRELGKAGLIPSRFFPALSLLMTANHTENEIYTISQSNWKCTAIADGNESISLIHLLSFGPVDDNS